MRVREEKNGIILKAYAGTTGILLAFDIAEKHKDGLLGFAIRRKVADKNWRWLQGLLKFPTNEPPDFKPANSNVAPIQKFRWSDYTVVPDTSYSYEISAVHGSPGNLIYTEGPAITLKTESCTSGKHRIIFNRAVAASQAYTRRFGKTNPDDESDPLHDAARSWLTRGLREQVENFMREAKDESYALDLALFEFEYDGFVDLLMELKSKGVTIKVIYHGQPGDKQTKANQEHLGPIPSSCKKARHTTGLFHQKFIILKKRDDAGAFVPQAVLTGTANFTPNGLWRQANVVHAIYDSNLAKEYDTLFKQLLQSKGLSDTKRHINNNHPLKNDKDMFQSFSPRSGYCDIDFLEQTINTASSEVFICSAFKLHDRITAALQNISPKVSRFGLQNSRTTITGFHRNKSFTAPAFLKDGLEGFLKESTAKQRGTIYIHLKTLITDFTTDAPTVIVGSHNFSKPASDKNDENFVVIKGDTEVADTYFCEMMRLYDHYRFRYNQKKKGTGLDSRLTLCPNNSWITDYYNPEHIKYDERVRFARSSATSN